MDGLVDTSQNNIWTLPIWRKVDALPMDSVIQNKCDLDSNLTYTNTQIEEIVAKIDSISTYGVGMSDIIGVIAFPLILMLFAFAIPFIFNSINHINSKYDSKVLCELFDKSKYYQYIKCSTIFSLAFVFSFGIIFLCMSSDCLKENEDYFSWSSLVTAANYSISVLLFIYYCIKYNNPDKLLGIIKKTYKKESKKKVPSLLKTWQWKWQLWWHKNNPEWQSAFRQAIRVSSGWSEASPDNLFNQRLIALGEYALRRNDIELFYHVLDGIDSIIEIEKHSKKRSFWGASDKGVKECSPHYLSLSFFKDIFEYYSSCSKNKNIESTLLWKMLASFNKSLFVSSADILWISQMLLKLCDLKQISILAGYIDRSKYYFSFIPKLPKVHFVNGLPAEDRSFTEEKSVKNWDELCNYHFLVFAYAMSIGRYELLNILMDKNHSYVRHLYPFSTEDILIRYAKCKGKLNGRRYVDRIRSEEMFDGSIEVSKIVDRYAMMLFLISIKNDIEITERATKEDISLLCNNKADLLKIATLVKEEKFFLPFAKTEKELSNIYDTAVGNIEQSVLLAKAKDDKLYTTDNKQSWKEILLNYLKCSKGEKDTNKHPDYFDMIVPDDTKTCFESHFSKCKTDIERFLGLELKDCIDSNKAESVDIGRCSFLINKASFITDVKDYDIGRSLYFDYVDLFVNRIAYALLIAFGRMKMREVEVTPVDFHNYIDEYTQKRYDQFVIIDVDSHISGWIDLDYSNGFRANYKRMPFISLDSVGKFSLLTDLESYDAFKESLIIVKKEAFPCLTNTVDDGKMKFEYIDESSKEKGKILLRVGVDLQKKIIFNAADKIIKVRMKKINL